MRISISKINDAATVVANRASVPVEKVTVIVLSDTEVHLFAETDSCEYDLRIRNDYVTFSTKMRLNFDTFDVLTPNRENE